MNCNGSKVVLESSAEEKEGSGCLDRWQVEVCISCRTCCGQEQPDTGSHQKVIPAQGSRHGEEAIYSIVRPHLEYANVVWHPRFKKEIVQIERVQRRATKLVPGLRDTPYEDRLQQLDLPSLVYRRYRGDMIEVYKYVNGLNYTSHNGLLPRASASGLRGHDFKW